MNLEQEFDRQLNNLLQYKYPEAASLSENEFLQLIEPLRTKIKQLVPSNIDLETGSLPFVIVVKSDLVKTEKAMSKVNKEGKTGIIKLFPLGPSDFHVLEVENIPSSLIYLLVDIERGRNNINLPPNEAIKMIRKENRFPLTIDEGVAIVTHYPEFLIKNNCFSLLASRTGKDQRVPAIWINADKEPNLGWCWDGNPHTWLGSASGKLRIE